MGSRQGGASGEQTPYRIVLDDSARLDLREIYEWYERAQPELGGAFLLHFQASIECLRSFPESGRLVRGRFRRLAIKRFPYASYYCLDKRTVVIMAVIHTSRDRKRIIHRLRDKT